MANKIFGLLVLAHAGILLFSAIAFAQDGNAGSVMDLIPSGMSVKIVAWLIGLQAILWGLATGLTEISVHTENKYDNMLARAFSKAAWGLGSLLGFFGVSTPKQMAIKKADKATKKDLLR